MSLPSLTPLETRLKNLVLIAQLTIVFSLVAVALYIILGVTSQQWYNYLVAGSFLLVTLVAFLIIRHSQKERPIIGAWHLLFSGSLTALVMSTIQATSGAEIGTAFLILILVLVIQTFPQKHIMLGALLGAITSMACSILAFYSPLPQTTDATANLVITWVARGSTLVFLFLGFRQFRSLNLASKLLLSFLGVVVLTSMTFNIILSTTTTNTLTDQIGEQLNTVAKSRASVVGDYLAGQVEVLKTLALDETIRQSVRAANALKPDLENILALDERWQQALANGSNDSLIHSRLSSSLSNDLRAFQSISPQHIEVFVTDKQGALVASTGITSDYYQADEPWWQSAYQQEDAYISSPIFDESANALSILMAVPIYDTRQGDLIGILRTTISIDGLISVIDDPIGETGEADIYFPEVKMLDTKNVEYEEIDPNNLVSIQDSANLVFLRTSFEGKETILARTQVLSNSRTSNINELGWSVIVSQDAEEALAPVHAQVRLSSLFGTFIAGFASLLSLLVAQRLAEPIINLTETASEVARGDLKARAEVNSHDEIGQLSETFNAMTAKLQETLVGLEARVAERTLELEKSSQLVQKRAGQFEAIAQLARTTTSIQDLEKLLPHIAQQVSQLFGFYHVGLFLLDESRQYAVLCAANSEGGQRMLVRKHRLGVGQTGIVGYVTATGHPRIVLDTGIDTVYFDNPDLPETRSEMALPLRVGGSIIGALDVQSTKPNAFTEDDVEVLSILADEVSVAIDNARHYAESQRVLADAQSAFQEYTLESWRKLVTKRKLVGYELSGVFIRPLEKPVKSTGSTVSIPIKLRNQVIGSMNISLPAGREWSQDEMEIAQAMAERVGIVSESAILLEESQRLAAKEHTIGQISEKFIASTDISEILKTAVQEISQIISGAEIAVQLEETVN